MHSQLNHDNVVKLHEYTESEEQFVLFMEYANDAEYFDNKIVEVSNITSDRYFLPLSVIGSDTTNLRKIFLSLT